MPAYLHATGCKSAGILPTDYQLAVTHRAESVWTSMPGAMPAKRATQQKVVAMGEDAGNAAGASNMHLCAPQMLRSTMGNSNISLLSCLASPTGFEPVLSP